MSISIEQNFEQRNIKNISIGNKLDLYFAFRNLDAAFPNSLDSSLLTLSFEIVQLLINSVKLMEIGYFDASHYSLRQAHELSWIFFLMADLDSEDKKNLLWNKWKNQEFFPDTKQIREKLKNEGRVYRDFNNKMSDFFEEVEITIKKLNKLVHKQGFHRFYVSVNHQLSNGTQLKRIKEDFLSILQLVVRHIAISRLSCDPFPILFADYDIISRLDSSPFTIPYNDDFISNYIGNELLQKYKQTDIYQEYYSYYIQMSKKPEPIVSIIQYNTILIEKEREIIEGNLNLLTGSNLCATIVVLHIRSVFRVTIDSLSTYYTDRKSKEVMFHYTNEFVANFSNFTNQLWKDWMLSSILINNKTIYIEHDSPISAEQISEVIQLLKCN